MIPHGTQLLTAEWLLLPMQEKLQKEHEGEKEQLESVLRKDSSERVKKVREDMSKEHKKTLERLKELHQREMEVQPACQPDRGEENSRYFSLPPLTQCPIY